MEPITEKICPLFQAARIIAEGIGEKKLAWYSNRCKEEKCMWYEKCMNINNQYPIYYIMSDNRPIPRLN